MRSGESETKDRAFQPEDEDRFSPGRDVHELAAANVELEAFVSSVSHDLRAPVLTLRGFASLLRENYGSALCGEGLQWLTQIERAALRMDAVIADLLELSRGLGAPLERKWVDLSAMACGILEDGCALQPGRSSVIRVAQGVRAFCNPGLAHIILTNLLGNAAKYSARERTSCIEFGVREDAPAVYFVRDNGVGFDCERRSLLFEAFQRLHPEDGIPGTGIGLSTVKRAIRRHGGQIWAESERGAGAAFYFTLCPRS